MSTATHIRPLRAASIAFVSSPGRAIAHLIPTLVVAVGLLWPVYAIAAQGLSLVGILEESSGYRYFHTLRILYGENERPWLPQGQTAGLAYFVVQVALTFLGYPPTQLMPRFDLFAYSAAGIPLVLTTLAFCWAMWPVRSLGVRLLAALGLLFVATDASTFNGLAIYSPDYYSWAFIAALVTVGGLLRLQRHTGAPGWRPWLLVGLFLGMCLAMKPTYVIYLVPLFGWMVLSSWSIANYARAVVAGLVGIIVALVIVAAYYLGSLEAFREHFRLLAEFGRTADTPGGGFSAWITGVRFTQPQAILLALLMPVLLLVSLITLPERRMTLVLLAGMLLAVLVVLQRFYSATFVETNAMGLTVVVVWLATAATTATTRWFKPRHGASGRLLTASGELSLIALAALGGYLVWPQYARLAHTTEWSAIKSTEADRAVAAFLQAAPGKTAVLIPDNMRRPLTSHSAIYKGGTDIFNADWGASPYVASLVKDTTFVNPMAGSFRRPADLHNIDTLVLVVGPAPSTQAMLAYTGTARITSWAATTEQTFAIFGIRLSQFDCPVESFAPNNSLVVACRRRQDVLPNGPVPVATSVESFDGLTAQASVVEATGDTRPVKPGDLLYVAANQELFRADPDERFTRLAGTAGERIRLVNQGNWDRSAQRVEGLDVVNTDGGATWAVAADRLVPATSPLAPGEGSNQLAVGWELIPATAPVSLEWLADEAGPYLRVTATGPNASFLLRRPVPRSLEEAPATARLVARASAPSIVTWLTLFDVNGPGRDQTYAKSGPLTSEWEAVTLQTPPIQGPTDSDSVAAGASQMQPGDTVDFRLIDLFDGLVPPGLPATCCQIPTRRLGSEGGPAQHVPTVADLRRLMSSGAAAAGQPRTVYLADSGSILELDEHGGVTRLVGRQGAHARVTGVGAWDAARQEMLGLDATFRRGRWRLDSSAMQPSNPDPRFEQATSASLGPDWSLSPPDAVTIHTVREGNRAYLRLVANRPIPSLRLEGREPLPAHPSAPVTAVASVRAHRLGPMVTLRLLDDPSAPAPPAALDRRQPAQDWQRFSVSLEQLRGPAPSRGYALTIDDLQAGDIVDIDGLAVYLGLLE